MRQSGIHLFSEPVGACRFGSFYGTIGSELMSRRVTTPDGLGCRCDLPEGRGPVAISGHGDGSLLATPGERALSTKSAAVVRRALAAALRTRRPQRGTVSRRPRFGFLAYALRRRWTKRDWFNR